MEFVGYMFTYYMYSYINISGIYKYIYIYIYKEVQDTAAPSMMK